MNQNEHKIYYKGNPYTRQNYIPTSALKNRSIKNYLVELPQGAQYFGGSRKKQYSYIHNQSQIKDKSLFYEEPTNYTHGTLKVSDIEGAVPNSLISQAIKNRIKGNYWHNSRVKSVQSVDEAQNQPNIKAPAPEENEERLKRNLSIHNQTIGTNNNVNYHLRKNRVYTEPLQNYIQSYKPQNKHSNNIQKQIVQFKYNPNVKLIPDTTRTDNYIALEEELFKKQQNRLKPSNLVNENAQIAPPVGRNLQLIPKISHQNDISLKNVKGQADINRRHRSVKQIKDMWQGDSHKIRLFPNKQIRKFNPTYLSTDNYIESNQVFKSNLFKPLYK